MIAIIDYGVGNLFSLAHSLTAVGAEAVVTGEAEVIRRADHVILPGVGALGDAAKKLRETKLDALVKDIAARGTPIMGICLGMQLLLEKSFEFGEHAGLGLIPGEVMPIAQVIPADYKIPHIGWNALELRYWHRYTAPNASGNRFRLNPPLPHTIFEKVEIGDCVYFVHSFYGAKCDDYVIATAEYGAPLTAAVGKGNVVGCQFHPEKSGDVGLRILKSFTTWDGQDNEYIPGN
ncbi:MAG: imidazole glycerol phosphate synthase subunit HisH [Clostridia bacterium]|nr:imidazole glycerol phosphate synthase subunit HisH [Clostridia bacterium]